MDPDGRNGRGNTTRVAVLSIVSTCVRLFMSQRTYQTSSADLEGASRATRSAVGSRHDGVGVEEGTSAPRAAIVRDADDEGKVTSAGSRSADDHGSVLRPSGNKRRNKCDDGSELDHGEEQAEDSKSRELKSEERLLELRDC